VKEQVEALIRDLQSAVAGRLLYPPDHPRNRVAVERILEQVRSLAPERGWVAAFLAGDRLVHEGTVLGGVDAAARGLFRTLRSAGFDRLALAAGLEADELGAFLTALAEAGRRADAGALRSSPHIQLASLQAAAESPEAAGDDRPFLSEEVGTLQGVWSGIVSGRGVDHDSLDSVVLTLSRTVEDNLGAMLPLAALKTHDEYTATHIVNVGLLAMALSEALGLPRATVRDVGIAALLHDVGKLRVPLEVLNKPDRLTDKEATTLRRHPEDGARLLFSAAGVPEVAVLVAYEHHIKFDGSGYPKVPASWRPSLASAITQVADVYDALRTDRPYRRGLERERIRDMMLADAGTHFEPDLLATFFESVVPADALG